MVKKNIEISKTSILKPDEVCSLTGIKPYVLRFWESEFEQIAPTISATGERLFQYKDIHAVFAIKELLFEQKMTIEKAKMIMDKEKLRREDGPELEGSKRVETFKVNELEINPTPAKFATVDLVKNQKNTPFEREEKFSSSKLNEVKGLLKDLLLKGEAIKKTYNWV